MHHAGTHEYAGEGECWVREGEERVGSGGKGRRDGVGMGRKGMNE